MRSYIAVPLLFSTLGRAVEVSLPIQAPSHAPTISPSLASFSIEGDRWTEWSGATSRNQFFYNCLDNLQKLTGAPPDIRIGANSEDRTNYNPEVEIIESKFPAYDTVTPYPEALNNTVGDGYYRTARFLPPHTRVTWGVNLGQLNVTAAYLEAQALVRVFNTQEFKRADITLDFIDIGNEPDLYRTNNLRPTTYTSDQWVREWTLFATNVSQAAKMTPHGRLKFRLGSFSGKALVNGPPFLAGDAIKYGILDSAAGKLATVFSHHRYSGSFCEGSGALLQDLMTKTSIRGNITLFSADIEAVKARGLEYILGETNSFSCHGAPGVSNSAGAALWTLDYLLFAPQAGVSKVYFHEGIGFKYNLIQPATLTRSIVNGSDLPAPIPPHVQPQYYAAIIAAEAIGTSGSTSAIELTINDPQISGYAFFEHKKLVRAVFINLRAFLKGREPGSRASAHLDLSFAGHGYESRKMTVKRLKIGFADDLSGLTWGGQSYETPDAKPSGKVTTETVAVADGVHIAETEVVLLSFH